MVGSIKLGGRDRRILIQSWPGQKASYLKNKLKTRGDKVLARQV
jgi:hypothetical protein